MIHYLKNPCPVTKFLLPLVSPNFLSDCSTFLPGKKSHFKHSSIHDHNMCTSRVHRRAHPCSSLIANLLMTISQTVQKLGNTSCCMRCSCSYTTATIIDIVTFEKSRTYVQPGRISILASWNPSTLKLVNITPDCRSLVFVLSFIHSTAAKLPQTSLPDNVTENSWTCVTAAILRCSGSVPKTRWYHVQK